MEKVKEYLMVAITWLGKFSIKEMVLGVIVITLVFAAISHLFGLPKWVAAIPPVTALIIGLVVLGITIYTMIKNGSGVQ